MSPTGGALPRFHSSKMSSKGGRVSATHSLPSWCLRTFQEHAKAAVKTSAVLRRAESFQACSSPSSNAFPSRSSRPSARTRVW